MDKHLPEHDSKPLRRLRIERREAAARANGWAGPWPPEKPCIESAADCEHYLARLENGEQRAAFFRAIANGLLAFFQELEAQHFQRFGAVLLPIAENRKAAHRTRLRAAQAPLSLLRKATTLIVNLHRHGDDERRAYLETLLEAFCEALPTDGFRPFARVLDELAGAGAKTVSDKLRAIRAIGKTVLDTMVAMAEASQLRPFEDPSDPELRGRAEEVEQKLAELRRAGRRSETGGAGSV